MNSEAEMATERAVKKAVRPSARGKVLTEQELDAIAAEPWTAHLHSYDDLARTFDALRRSAKAWKALAEARGEIRDELVAHLTDGSVAREATE